MRLTQKQVEYIRQEQKTLRRIIASKPEVGLFRYVARQEALNLISQLHNMEIDKNG